MKTCRMMFYSDYVSDEELKLAVKNSSCLDKCFIGFYDKTWSGREMNSVNKELLMNIQDTSSNAEVVWIKEEELKIFHSNNPMLNEAICRNLILDKAIEEKFDFLVVQDTDEFVHEEDWEFLLKDYFPSMVSFGYDTCAIRWKNFWKSWNHLLLSEETLISGWPGEWTTFGINLKGHVRFSSGRDTKAITRCGILQDDVFLYHGSWVLDDEQVQKKITSWGHSKDMNYEDWYSNKWLNWNEETTDLHPSPRPHIWKKAIPYNGKLPKECVNWTSSENPR